VAYYFNILTPISTPANVLAVPLCVLVLISNLLSLLLACWVPSISVLFNHAGWFCMEIIRVTSEWFAHWPAAYYYIPAPAWFTIVLYYAVLLALVTGWLFRPLHRAWKLGVLSAVILIWGSMFCRQLPVTRLFVLPVHGGTAIYCDAFGSKKDLLIDPGSTNSVQFLTKPFLRAQGVNRAPPLVLTHGDIHHVGGVEPFRQAFPLDHIFTSPLRYRSTPYRRILARLASIKGLLSPIARDDNLAGWTVLHPSSTDRFPRADDGPLVLIADLRGTRVLLLSDLGSAGQKTLLERTPDLRADIVVAGLPSADEPLSDALLNAIDPHLIIISDSEFPISERASPKLRARLQRSKWAVLYTRATGSVAVNFGQGEWNLRTMSGLKLDSRQPNLAEAISKFTADDTSMAAAPKDFGHPPEQEFPPHNQETSEEAPEM
jgi:beta-lactamase superfamily II metal-dependent hydrolase